MFFHETIEDSVGREGNWRKTHSAELVLPISNFFGCEFDIGTFNIVKTGGNILNLNFLCFMRSNLDEI